MSGLGLIRFVAVPLKLHQCLLLLSGLEKKLGKLLGRLGG